MIALGVITHPSRRAQLDLLMRSIARNGGGYFAPTLIDAPAGDLFHTQVASFLTSHGHEFMAFACDDGILYRRPPLPKGWEGDIHTLAGKLEADSRTIAFSLRLGPNTTQSYPSDLCQEMPAHSDGIGWPLWSWTHRPWEESGDFYYPGSLDGHIFRTADVQRMLDGRTFPNPTALECALVEGCNELADERPLMACYPHSVYVGNPINRVSEQSGVRYGQTYPVTAEECNRRFLAGERIDLDALDFSKVNGAHTEIELVWKHG